MSEAMELSDQELVRSVAVSARTPLPRLSLIAGYEAIHMIRKGQMYESAVGAKVGLLHCFILGLFAAAN